MSERGLLNERRELTRLMLLDEIARASLSGEPMPEALRDASREAVAPGRVRRALGRIASAHGSGTQLSAAVAAEPALRSDAIVATLEAGERSGRLTEVLAAMRDAQARSLHQSRRVADALLHPALLLVSAIAVLTLVLVAPAPRMVGLAGSAAAPAAITGLVLMVGLVVAIAFALVGAGPARRLRDWVFAPGREAARAAQARALRLMLGAGVPEPEALDLSARAIDKGDYERTALTELAAAVRHGESVRAAAADAPFLDPLLIAALCRTEGASRALDRLALWRDAEAERLAADVERALGLGALIVAGIACALVMVVAWGGYYELVNRIH